MKLPLREGSWIVYIAWLQQRFAESCFTRPRFCLNDGLPPPVESVKYEAGKAFVNIKTNMLFELLIGATLDEACKLFFRSMQSLQHINFT